MNFLRLCFSMKTMFIESRKLQQKEDLQLKFKENMGLQAILELPFPDQTNLN